MPARSNSFSDAQIAELSHIIREAIRDGDVPVPIVIAQSHVPIVAPTDTAENTLVTIPIPGGFMGPNDSLRLTLKTSYTNSANAKTVRMRIGGTAVGSNAATTSSASIIQYTISNRNSLSSQIATSSITGSFGVGNGFFASSVNMAVGQNLTITSQLALAGESYTLESYILEKIPAQPA